MDNIKLAGCIIQNDKGKILLIHRNTAKRTQWEIPGGKIEEGEDPAATAAREVQEELGITVDVTDLLDTKSFTEDGHTMTYAWFRAALRDGTPKVMEPHIHDKWAYFSIAELEKLRGELSPNASNFLAEVRANRIVL